jgi:hypothetical protein
MRPEGPMRAERLAILRAAAAKTPWFGGDPESRRLLVRDCVESVLAVVRRRRRFDVIAEYGFLVPFLVAQRVIGLAEPRSLGLLPLSIWLGNRHPLLQVFRQETRAYLSDLVWSELVSLQLFVNFENRNLLFRALGRYGASRLRNHIEGNIDAFPATYGDQTLLKALWDVRAGFPAVKDDVYREHVVSIVSEVGGTIAIVPGSGFTGIVDRWLKPGGPGLGGSLRQLRGMDPEAFVQEQLRLAPPAAHLLRNTTRSLELGGLTLEEGEYVCALIKSAGTDVTDAEDVKAGRPPANHLHFGPQYGPHRCFGHLLAPALLAEMFLGLATLPRLAARSRPTSFMGSLPGRLILSFGAADAAV